MTTPTGDGPVRKDNLYYEKRLMKAHNERFERETAGKTGEEFFAILERFERESPLDMLVRISVNLNEASAIIRELWRDDGPTDPEKAHDLVWVDRMSALRKKGGGKLMQARMTRAEMLERLRWISGEEFGEDLPEWLDWITAFETNSPPSGYR
ncbi:MAG: hypothetical protein ACK5MQ_00590 [Pikeienuella sp.]